MTRQLPLPITDLLDLPVALRGVSSVLDTLFEQVRLIKPGAGSGDGDLLVPDAEREAIVEWFDSLSGWLRGAEAAEVLSSLPALLQNVVTFDPDQQQLKLQLAILTEQETSLAGMEGLSFVLPEQEFEAIASRASGSLQVVLGLDLALRLKAASFEPMRALGSGGGAASYEPDPSRKHTDVSLAKVRVAIAADGSVTFPNPLSVRLDQPVRLIAAANLLIEAARLFVDLTSTSKALAIRWETTQLGEWLGRLAPNFRAEGGPGVAVITLRLGLGNPMESVRLDWTFLNHRQNYRLPGIAITTPVQTRYTVLLQRSDSQRLNRFLFILTLPAAASQDPGAQSLTASSTFAWERSQGGDRAPQRELQNDSNPAAKADAKPLFKVDFIPQNEVSLALLDWTLTQPGLPTFFRQVPGGLPELNFDQPHTLGPSSGSTQLASLSVNDWELKAEFNTEAFDFPFLRNDQRDQRIRLNFKDKPGIDLANSLIKLQADAQVRISSLLLNSEFGINFNWETFALKVDHGDGLRLLSAQEVIEPAQLYLGLKWRFRGAPALNDAGEPIPGRFQHLTLVTKDYNYQVVQAPGATIEISYLGASEDPITFIASNLAITDKGITLTAEISDRPAKLNGLDTRFRFHGSRLEIVENRIQDFTLAGSGPLPPDLVGEAIADIVLQFSQRNGALTLVSGAANLRGNELLSCQGTRFKFSIDALGLKFVNDGRFHLYFTLTGSAQFSPLPGDNPSGPLALLTGIKIQLVECPLTSDLSVIGKHVNFLIELPEKVSFSFLGCFEMEIRSIGFVPQFDKFGGAAAMEIGGQVKFAQGTGDVNTVKIDFHSLFIGLPPKGSFVPRLYMQELEVNISLGEAFKLNAVVEFRNNETEQGFLGEGVMEIPGMPIFAASFAFLRVRRSESEPWVKAWFIFVEARQVSLYIPFVELYIREIGLGFGYRYTIASIKAADEANNLSQLIGNLRELSRTQGDLSKRDRWSVDLEGPGESLRWTIVLRALISQTSATPGAISLKWLEHVEQTLPCLFLFDAIIAFRSDLTFFMAVRAWLNSNYYDYVNDVNELRERPLFSGFVLLSVRQKRFLAQISSNPNGSMGTRPPLPVFVEQAILNGQFAATILIEPGLLHAELGWPNMLRWGQKIGPLEAEMSGGMIFRVSKHYLVLGISYKARGSLSFDARLNLKIVGVRVSAHASFAWGARFIGLVDFANPAGKSALYAAIGIEMSIRVSIALWIKLLFIRKTYRLSLEIGFTAGLELGLDGLTNPGLRGSGTLFISTMGHNLQVNVKLGLNERAVQTALTRTAPFLNLGLEASDVQPVPGVGGAASSPQGVSEGTPRAAARAVPMAAMATASAVVADGQSEMEGTLPPASLPASVAPSPETIEGTFSQPNYDLFVIRPPEEGGWGYFVLLPRAETEGDAPEEQGFVPVPPDSPVTVEHDFELTLPPWAEIEGDAPEAQDSVPVPPDSTGVVGDPDLTPALPEDFELQHFRPVSSDQWQDVDAATPLRWKIDWGATIETATQYEETGAVSEARQDISLGRYLSYAFRIEEIDGQDVPVADPDAIAARQETLTDDRVQNPSEGAYEAAVRGALEQFRSSPFFKHDPTSLYEQALEVAFRDNTSIYTATGKAASGETGPVNDADLLADEQANQQAHQLRGLIVQDMIADLQDYAQLPDGPDPQATEPKDLGFVESSIGFQMGLVFRYRGQAPDWLDRANPASAPTLKQRRHRLSTTPDSASRTVRTFNVKAAGFAANPPQFEQVQPLTDTNTIAIAWELTWNQPPEADCSACQRDPNQHLLHYQVRRRCLDGNEPEAFYTVKPAAGACFEAHFRMTEEVIELLVDQGFFADDSAIATDLRALPEFTGADAFLAALREHLPPAVHPFLEDNQHALEEAGLQADGGVLKRLQPRFQLVDHFIAETLEDQAAMPATGRSYLYSITPIDFTKTPGRPLTLVATRYPSEPPRVPVDGEFIVQYQLESADWTLAGDPEQPVSPAVVVPSQIRMQWSDPVALRDGPAVPVAQHRLIFRKDSTLPIGSYGLDSSTQGPRSKNLPTTNARTLPTDIKILLQPPAGRANNRAVVTATADGTDLMVALQRAGVLPGSEAGDLRWRPEAWQVFLQTESVNGVPSALAPVKLLLQFKTSGSGDNLEERQPAQLEWLPRPLRLPMLPPEDSRIVAGIAHVPMPGLKEDALFSGSLDGVTYRPHPAQLRLLRLRWNQGPSHQPQYPLNLNASYTLLELDVDAHTNQTFSSTARLAAALREIQQVQLLPAEDLPFTPKDTLTANQWEAWYPSRVRRLEDPVSAPVEGDQLGQSPWYSWRESQLVWPAWPTLTDPTQREAALHPFLQALVETLDENPQGYLLPNGQTPLTTYNVDVQYGPPRVAGDLAAFQELTAPSADPYGWSILLRLGLSIGLTLRDESTNELVLEDDLLRALQTALDALRADTKSRIGSLPLDHWLSHLHVELLVQPSRCFEPQTSPVEVNSLLAMVQLSLRPRVQQYLSYSMLEIQGPARSRLDIPLQLAGPCTLIDQSTGAGGEQDLPPNTPIVQAVTLPLNGQTRLLLRYPQEGTLEVREVVREVRFPLRQAIDLPQQLENAKFRQITDVGSYLQVSIEALNTFQQSLSTSQREALRQTLRDALAAADAVVADALLDIKITPLTEFSPRDERSTYFRVPADLATDLAKTDSDRGQQWRQIKLYLESINSTDPTLPAIALPTSAAEIAQLLPDFLNWSQRFFDASADVDLPAAGPWLVTAYPRLSTPSYVSPDASGRLKYDHLLSDRWAHNYRYYIRPSSRYDLLWQSLLESPDLFPPRANPADPASDVIRPLRELDTFVLSARSLVDLDGKLPKALVDALYPLENQRYLGETSFLVAAKAMVGSFDEGQQATLLAAVETFREVLPDPAAGGLDITLDRTQPIDKPLVLSSSRLDPAGTPSNPAAPGRTWEVMVAQHLEQRLVERNQTLVRRLAYRQVAFTLLRRFAYGEWQQQLMRASSYSFELELVKEIYPALPTAYPEWPDHLNLDALSADEARSLDLPLRNGNFQQGALVLQWDALPFFYEHRLLLIAQSATTVSAPNEIVQRDFEYRTPKPKGEVVSIAATVQVNPNDSAINLHTRQVTLPLKPLWDALPAHVQAQWAAEDPATDPATSRGASRKPASLPDPEVIYQVVELYSGNLEVQVEYFFDPSAGQYVLRQLGDRFLGELRQLLPPPAAQPQADFKLETGLHQIHELQLQREIYFESPPMDLATTEAKVLRRQAPSLFLVGGVDRQDRVNLLINSVPGLFKSPLPRAGTGLTAQENSLDEWYSTRVFADPPVSPPDLGAAVPLPEGGTAVLPDLVDYPEVPKLTTIPRQLRSKLTIRPDLITWQGTILEEEKAALKLYSSRLPDYQEPAKAAISSALKALAEKTVTTPYDLPPLRPHPAGTFIGGFAIAVIYPPNPEPNWVLRWTGPMDTATENRLTQATNTQKELADGTKVPKYEPQYRQGIAALISKVQAARAAVPTAPISSNSPLPATPEDLSDKLSTTPANTSSPNATTTTHTMQWQGSMTIAEESLLRTTFRNQPEEVVDAVNQLIDDVLAAAPRPTVYEQTIAFAWPRHDQLDPSQRTQTFGHPLTGLSLIDAAGASPQLQWQGADNLGISGPNLVALVRRHLEPGDPFISAFADLIPQLDIAYSAPMRLKFLRLRGPLSIAEQAALRQLFSNHLEAIEALLADISDRAAIDQLYNSGFSQQPISAPVPLSAPLNAVVDFPTPSETVLVWQGEVSATERTEALALTGDEAFTTALEQLTRLRPATADLPEEIRAELEITPASDMAAGTLTWNAPAYTDAQIQSLQGLVGDEIFEASLRRLVSALLANRASPELVSVPLEALPSPRQISIPLPAAATTRPTTATLPATLQGKLLIGNAMIRYHGLMTLAEGQALDELYTHSSDRAAVERLFQTSTQQGLQGRELRLQARRGSAAPSDLVALTPQSLTQA